MQMKGVETPGCDFCRAAGAQQTQGQQASQQGGGGSAAGPAPTAAYAVPGHAWLCLGKLCLVDEALAKRVVPLFVQVGGYARTHVCI